MKLNKSNVIFNEVNHTYELNGVQLSGVTAVLKKYLFTNKYADVPDAVLARACNYGHNVHSQMQMWINELPFDAQYDCVTSMQKELKGCIFVEAEFTVSDNICVASQIDAIERLADGTFCLWDWKTTRVLDKDYLAWQLSIYKYLFEMQTGCKVSALKAGWIREERCKIVDIEEIKEEYVSSLLKAFAEGAESFANPRHCVERDEDNNEDLTTIYNIESKIKELEIKLKELKEEKEIYLTEKLAKMQSAGLKKIEGETITLSIKTASERVTLDTKKLKEERPDVYDEYSKLTKIAESLQVKIKG